MKALAWLYRLLPYLGRRRAEEDLQEELRLHLEFERERQRDAGLSENDARRAARRRLGNAALIRERTRDVWGWRWLDDLGRDVRHAVRGLGQSPVFTAAVVLVLALGIGANTAMFGIVHGVLLRPLPYPDAGAIVRIGESQLGTSGVSEMRLSNRSMPLLEESTASFEQLAAYQERSVESASLDGATLSGARVSPSLFPLLRSTPHLGRLFTEEEARVGADRVVLLSHGAWTRRFASDPDIVGTLVDLDGDPHTVVGVLAEGFYFPNPDSEFWTPYVIPPFTPPSMEGPAAQRMVLMAAFDALGRLRPGVSPAQAASEARTILQGSSDAIFVRATGNQPAGDRPEVDVRVVPLLQEMVGEYRPALLALAAATALVLLIACINVAGLLLARGVTRRRTLAVCAALGAGRGRLVRQLLTESMALSLSGGLLGLAAAAVVLRAAPALVPVEVARLDEVGIDTVVLVFTVGLSIVVGLLFGAAPAFQWSRVGLVRALNEGGAQSAGGFRLLRSNRTRAALATAQVALTLVLLIGAGLLLRSFVRLVSFDRGYDPANVITTVVRNPMPGQPAMTPAAFLELRATHRRTIVPDDDRPGAEPVAMISHSFRERRFGPEGSPVGTVFRVNDVPTTIVGVLPPGYAGIGRPDAAAADLHLPLATLPLPERDERLADATLWWLPIMGRLTRGATPAQVQGNLDGVLRTAAQSALASFLDGLTEEDRGRARNRNRSAEPRLLVDSGRQGLYDANPRSSGQALVLGVVVTLVLLIVCANVATLLLSRAVSRQREVAIRMSVGATRARLIRQLVTESLLVSAAGGMLALPVAWAARRLLPFGQTNPFDWRVFAFAGGLSLAAGLAFSLVPALRATRAEPSGALKEQSRSVTRSRSRLSRALIVAQVAVSLALLVGAGLFLKTLANLRGVDVGFNPDHVLLFQMDSTRSGYDPEESVALYARIGDRVRVLPGVRSVTMAQTALLGGGVWKSTVHVEGQTGVVTART